MDSNLSKCTHVIKPHIKLHIKAGWSFLVGKHTDVLEGGMRIPQEDSMETPLHSPYPRCFFHLVFPKLLSW